MSFDGERKLTRRDFLKWTGLVGAGALAACAPNGQPSPDTTAQQPTANGGEPPVEPTVKATATHEQKVVEPTRITDPVGTQKDNQLVWPTSEPIKGSLELKRPGIDQLSTDSMAQLKPYDQAISEIRTLTQDPNFEISFDLTNFKSELVSNTSVLIATNGESGDKFRYTAVLQAEAIKDDEIRKIKTGDRVLLLATDRKVMVNGEEQTWIADFPSYFNQAEGVSQNSLVLDTTTVAYEATPVGKNEQIMVYWKSSGLLTEDVGSLTGDNAAREFPELVRSAIVKEGKSIVAAYWNADAAQWLPQAEIQKTMVDRFYLTQEGTAPYLFTDGQFVETKLPAEASLVEVRKEANGDIVGLSKVDDELKPVVKWDGKEWASVNEIVATFGNVPERIRKQVDVFPVISAEAPENELYPLTRDADGKLVSGIIAKYDKIIALSPYNGSYLVWGRIAGSVRDSGSFANDTYVAVDVPTPAGTARFIQRIQIVQENMDQSGTFVSIPPTVCMNEFVTENELKAGLTVNEPILENIPYEYTSVPSIFRDGMNPYVASVGAPMGFMITPEITDAYMNETTPAKTDSFISALLEGTAPGNFQHSLADTMIFVPHNVISTHSNTK